jgi:hypothetical protein
MMGITGTTTTNSGSLLEICNIETDCRPLFVITTVAAALTEFTVVDPKLNEDGLTPTPAWAGKANNIAIAIIIPRDRRTNRVLCIRSQSFVFDLWASREREGGVPFDAHNFYGSLRIELAVLSDYWCQGQFRDR